ncbi:unnamed protein product [Rodentolepis nana]|uniref:Very-long-chain 3-oxoacyl-CoA synthase n=1 Tax=Rodentolepis nana TaxID=102285 RepID=A0A0R3TQV5_RODNA|nr:unnamed protein product [Rodentolepis nana]
MLLICIMFRYIRSSPKFKSQTFSTFLRTLFFIYGSCQLLVATLGVSQYNNLNE